MAIFKSVVDVPFLGVIPDLLFCGVSWSTYENESESGKKIIRSETAAVLSRLFKVASLLACLIMESHPAILFGAYLVFGLIQVASQYQADRVAKDSGRISTNGTFLSIGF